MKAASPEALRASPGANLPADSPDPDAGESWTRAAEQRVRELLAAQDAVEHLTVAHLTAWLRDLDHGQKYSYARELGHEMEHLASKIAAHLVNTGEVK
jgi:truncated hemoglobin YjbI